MNFDGWMLLAGIGIFLFGIYLMEEALKTLSGKAFKSFIRRYTSSTLKSITSGAFATAILQSSSAVTLMVLAFVGAGIMSLTNAIRSFACCASLASLIRTTRNAPAFRGVLFF